MLYNDQKIAEEVCDKENKGSDYNSMAREKVQKKYSNLLLSISHKFVHYKTERYNPVEDYDNVLNTYEWLSKKMIQLCCKYKKMLKVPLDTYLKSCIYNNITKLEWHKYNFQKKYKIEEYIPKCISVLDSDYQKIFKFLFRRKSIEYIKNEMGYSYDELENKVNKIKGILYRHGRDYFLDDSMHNMIALDETINTPNNIDTEVEMEINDLKMILDKSINSISAPNKRLLIMYWGAGLKASQITSISHQANFKTKLEDFMINTDTDLYKHIGIICKEINDYINKHYSNHFIDYDLNIAKIRKILKLYFFYIHDTNKNIEENIFFNQIKRYILT